MFQVSEFLDRVHNNLKELFLQKKQDYKYYLSFLKKNTKLINIQLLKYKYYK